MNGYWSYPSPITVEEFERVGEYISKWDGRSPLMLRNGFEFHQFGPDETPDALCRYCWSPNLHTSTHCGKCGGPMVNNTSERHRHD